MLELTHPDGMHVKRKVVTDDGGWWFPPAKPWETDNYRLLIGRELEDVVS